MMNDANGKGINPYVVNFVSFSGHGVEINGDAIALIPMQKVSSTAEWPYEKTSYISCLNISMWARKFSQKNGSVNIFLFNASRNTFDSSHPDYEVISEKIGNKYDVEGKDALLKVINEGKSGAAPRRGGGYSIILFASRSGEMACETKDGSLGVAKFVKALEQA